MNNDWNEHSKIQCDQYTINQIEGTAFDSDYSCYRIFWKDWISKGAVQKVKKINSDMVAKITNYTEWKILATLY